MTGDPLHVVAVGAHPDDIELTMAGLLVRFANAGHRTTWIVATDGAAGTGDRDPALLEVRMREATAGAKVGRATLVTLGFPDGRLAWVTDGPAAIGGALEAFKPDLIVTHALNDYHADHRAAARLVGDTAPIGVPVLRADTMLGVPFLPDLLVDITDVFDVKLAALATHASQSSLTLASAVTVWNRFRGLQPESSRFVHAEAYAVDRRLGVEFARFLIRSGVIAFSRVTAPRKTVIRSTILGLRLLPRLRPRMAPDDVVNAMCEPPGVCQSLIAGKNATPANNHSTSLASRATAKAMRSRG